MGNTGSKSYMANSHYRCKRKEKNVASIEWHTNEKLKSPSKMFLRLHEKKVFLKIVIEKMKIQCSVFTSIRKVSRGELLEPDETLNNDRQWI